MDPLIFEPYLRPVVWGGRKLGELLGKSLPSEETYGESWELSPHRQHVSRVCEGELAGRTLNELCQQHRADVFGPDCGAADAFPLLIKFLDCRELLSIQVHPDDLRAQQLADETFGKTEAWVVLHAEPDAAIYAGFQQGVTREDVERHLAAGTLEQILHSITPQAGDCLYLPAGTVHAVGGGVLMAEVQQASDATFRLYDWNRVGTDGQPRKLHIEQALASINWDAGPVQPVSPSVQATDSNCQIEQLVACANFGIRRVTLHAGACRVGQTAGEIWIVLDGSATLSAASGYRRMFQRGETVLIPASAHESQWTHTGESATLLQIHLPASATGAK